MSSFSVVATRGALAESIHPVSVAVTDVGGRLLAHAGDPEFVTYWRSASKPFQLYPLIAGGGVERFGLDREMIALACASHNAEPRHREVGARWLKAIGEPESALSCGGHLSLWPEMAETMIRDRITPTALWSNCSGKHSGMLALAMLHGWPTDGYNARPHPAQQLVAESVARWSGLREDELVWGVDGCTAAAVALSLRGMAVAYAQLGTSGDPSMTVIREAMLAEPFLVAGSHRLDTEVMEAWPQRIIAKIGAEGVYSAVLPELGLGIALKVEDGDMRAAGVALVAVLRQVTARLGARHEWPFIPLAGWVNPAIRNTRGDITGHHQAVGELAFA